MERFRVRRMVVSLAGTAFVVGAVLGLSSCTTQGTDDGDADTDVSTDAVATSSPSASGGYRQLFDGTQESLDRWRMAGPGEFVVQDDGSVLTVSGMGLLWYPERFEAYSLKLGWKVAGDDNSGVFVGFPEPGNDPGVAVELGYEIQIDATDEPDRTTGAIYSFQGADSQARDAALNPPGAWNAYEIVVEGRSVDVYLNGELINQFESSDPARDLTEGFIGLQNHGDDDEVYFRDVRIQQRRAARPPPRRVP